jgi:hypothetical protein
MITQLNLEELLDISGGRNAPSPAYELGHSIGKATSALLAAYGIYALFAV